MFFFVLVLVNYNNPGVSDISDISSHVSTDSACVIGETSPKLFSLHYNNISEITSKIIGLKCYHTFCFSSNIVGVADVHVDSGVRIGMKTTWCPLIERWHHVLWFHQFPFLRLASLFLIRYRRFEFILLCKALSYHSDDLKPVDKPCLLVSLCIYSKMTLNGSLSS